MNLSRKYIATFVLLAFAMLGWNVFLIQRDTQLMKNAPTIKERFCAQQTQPHPDCNVRL